MDDVLGFAGLACLMAAGFCVGVAVGLAVAGVCLLFAGWRVGR